MGGGGQGGGTESGSLRSGRVLWAGRAGSRSVIGWGRLSRSLVGRVRLAAGGCRARAPHGGGGGRRGEGRPGARARCALRAGAPRGGEWRRRRRRVGRPRRRPGGGAAPRGGGLRARRPHPCPPHARSGDPLPPPGRQSMALRNLVAKFGIPTSAAARLPSAPTPAAFRLPLSPSVSSASVSRPQACSFSSTPRSLN